MAWIFKRSIWKRMTGGFFWGGYGRRKALEGAFANGVCGCGRFLNRVSDSAFVRMRFLGWEESEWALGGRTDDFSDFGGARTWSLSGSRKLFDSLDFFTRFATGQPQANDLYGVWGNPSLDSEEAKSWEVGLKGTRMDWSWRLGAYRRIFTTSLHGAVSPPQTLDGQGRKESNSPRRKISRVS